MIVGLRQGHIGAFEHLQRRRDVQDGQRPHPLTVVARQTMRHAGATIMPDQMELRVPKRLHHLDHIQRHRALCVVAVVWQTRRLGTVAVTAQIGADHAVTPGQNRRDPVPDRQSLWVAMQQQHRFAGTRRGEIDRRAGCLDLATLETRKQRHRRSALFGETQQVIRETIRPNGSVQ
jgi:hypothetical protein